MSEKRRQGGLKGRIQRLIDKHIRLAADSKKEISSATVEKRINVIFLCFAQLKELGYNLAAPESFANRHVAALVTKWEAEGLAPATLQQRLSILRVFADWIGKPGMVQSAEHYTSNAKYARRTYAATHDKSWEGNGVDVHEIIARIEKEDPFVGAQLKAIFAFGLRRKEGVMLHPTRADKHLYLSVTDGTKGGRDRVVPIDDELKREVLEEIKHQAESPNGHLGRPGKTLKQNLRRISYLMEKYGLTKKALGVTLHGLRVQYLSNRFEEIAGIPSPVRGGIVTPENRERVEHAQQICTEEAGHARTSITTAYYGPLVIVKHPESERCAPTDNSQ